MEWEYLPHRYNVQYVQNCSSKLESGVLKFSFSFSKFLQLVGAQKMNGKIPGESEVWRLAKYAEDKSFSKFLQETAQQWSGSAPNINKLGV